MIIAGAYVNVSLQVVYLGIPHKKLPHCEAYARRTFLRFCLLLLLMLLLCGWPCTHACSFLTIHVHTHTHARHGTSSMHEQADRSTPAQLQKKKYRLNMNANMFIQYDSTHARPLARLPVITLHTYAFYTFSRAERWWLGGRVDRFRFVVHYGHRPAILCERWQGVREHEWWYNNMLHAFFLSMSAAIVISCSTYQSHKTHTHIQTNRVICRPIRAICGLRPTVAARDRDLT